MKPEDEEHTLVYIDMLGFKALTKRLKTRVIEERDEERGFLSSYTSDIQNQINRFNNIVDQCVFNKSTFYPPIVAMLFSDCAFVDAGNFIASAFLAKEIMRELIKERVPVRMGLGRGTFYRLNFSTELGDSTISRCRFIGTAVVYAHEAEQCGGKGMRIFVHPSAAADLRVTSSTEIKLLPLPEPFEDADSELDYLHEQRTTGSADAADRRLFAAIAAMEEPSMAAEIRRQYDETRMALGRMRKANGRQPF